MCNMIGVTVKMHFPYLFNLIGKNCLIFVFLYFAYPPYSPLCELIYTVSEWVGEYEWDVLVIVLDLHLNGFMLCSEPTF